MARRLQYHDPQVVKDTPEACDGDDLGGASCTTLGFQGGTLTCDSTCLLDPSGCTP